VVRVALSRGLDVVQAASWRGLDVVQAASWRGLGVVQAALWRGLRVVQAASWRGFGVVQAASWRGLGVFQAALWRGVVLMWFKPPRGVVVVWSEPPRGVVCVQLRRRQPALRVRSAAASVHPRRRLRRVRNPRLSARRPAQVRQVAVRHLQVLPVVRELQLRTLRHRKVLSQCSAVGKPNRHHLGIGRPSDV